LLLRDCVKLVILDEFKHLFEAGPECFLELFKRESFGFSLLDFVSLLFKIIHGILRLVSQGNLQASRQKTLDLLFIVVDVRDAQIFEAVRNFIAHEVQLCLGFFVFSDCGIRFRLVF
jgi:hypothetical protein